MPKTEVRSAQILNATVGRSDINVATPGEAVVTKIVAGTGITISGTGADTGTGDVTLNAAGGGGVEEVFIGDSDPGTPYELWYDTDEPQTAASNYVIGPASSIDGDIALFDGTSGKLIKDAGVDLFSFATKPVPIEDGGTGVTTGLANVAFTNQANTLMGNQTLVPIGGDVAPRLTFNETPQPADARKFQIYVYNQEFAIVPMNDAESLTTGYLTLSRTGGLKVSSSYTEYSRSTPIGHWIDFTPSFVVGTLNSILTSAYMLVGKTLFICFYWQVTATAVPAAVQFTIPGGFLSRGVFSTPFALGGTVGVAHTNTGGSSNLYLYKDLVSGSWTAGTVYIAGNIPVPIL